MQMLDFQEQECPLTLREVKKILWSGSILE